MTFKLVPIPLLLIMPTIGICQNPTVSQRYEIEQKVSAAEAKQDFKETLRKIEKVWDLPNSRSICPSPDSKPRPCVTKMADKNFYTGEYESFVSNHPTTVPSWEQMQGGLAEVGWVPVDRVAKGRETLTLLEAMLTTHERRDCNDETGECREAVEAMPNKKGERVLAVCSVARIGGVWGAGRRCEPVAIITSQVSYVKAIVGYIPGRFTIPVDSTVADIEFYVQVSPGDTFLPSLVASLAAAQDALSSKPMSFRTELLPKSNPVRVLGVAGLRLSPVLAGTWWEKATIRIDVDREDGERGYITFSATFNLQFNKQNTDRPEDFRAPTEAQFNRYRDAFSDSIKQQLPKLCPTVFWKDSTTLVCRSR